MLSKNTRVKDYLGDPSISCLCQVVQFKQQSRLEEKRKKALDLHLDFIVGQTEKYSDLLSQSLNQPLTSSKAGSSPCLGSSSAASSPPPPVSRMDDEGVCPL